MREETKVAAVQLPAEVVWEYLVDYDNVLRLGWDEASAHPLRPTKKCPVRYRASAVWGGIPRTYTACLTKSTRPSVIEWSTGSGGARSWVRFDLEPLGPSSTRVAVTLHAEAPRLQPELEGLTWGLLGPPFLQTISSLARLHELVSTQP